MSMDIVILGLSITSSWGNGHATTYRGLVRELVRLGHRVTFLERDVPWYACARDLPEPPYGRTHLYVSLDDLRRRFAPLVRAADAVIVGSYVPDGVAVGEWVQMEARGVTAFYDIDTPVTLARLRAGDHAYLSPELIPGFDLYLSFTGGPTLDRLEREYGSPCARAFYCAFDPGAYHPDPTAATRWDLGYLGTYSIDRQPRVASMLIEPARAMPERRFTVAGPLYPGEVDWPANVERTEHVPPSAHRAFYTAQRFTLNVTRDDMIAAGYSPSVRLFEAAACGVPIISDAWDGLDTIFCPGEDILVANGTDDVRTYLTGVTDHERLAIAQRARERVMSGHTARHRALQLPELLSEATLRRVRDPA
ncbi:glycosyltransferase [Luteibacter sp. PPL201]|uniref:Glycosyltransferase n=1 Tax=Luteibacter sahnii TaxID=3021977 RepID=A0ABT6BD16_9GAMM|nr:glycosyltransferase [Luteibacter sp. PPL193]MDY1549338.1 glycosyltransferase [Luteibacter sp. PPL193]